MTVSENQNIESIFALFIIRWWSDMAIKRNDDSTKKRGTKSSKSVGKAYRSSACGSIQTSVKNTSGKYGEVRTEVREMVKRRLNKHASTWTELAKR